MQDLAVVANEHTGEMLELTGGIDLDAVGVFDERVGPSRRGNKC
jgi:hypothetical protein